MSVASSYIEKSTVHGLHYLCKERKQNRFSHRTGWAITILISCVSCIWMCLDIRSKLNDSHTITAVASNTYPITKVPFPSVSICNVNKVSKRKFQYFKDILLRTNVSEYEIDAFGRSLASLLTFSTFDYYYVNNKSYDNIFEILQHNNYTVDILMRELQPDCKSLVVSCFFQSVVTTCSDYFEMIRTGEGYCCAFNYRGLLKYDDVDYTNFSAVKREPYYLLGYQMFGGVSAVFNIDKNDYLSPTRPIYGVTVLVGDPTDYPDVTSKSLTMEIGQRVSVQVEPSVMETTTDVFHLNQDIRNCWMPEEILTTEGVYSYQSCMTRCRALAMYEICGCIPFYYPPIGHDLRRKCKLSDNQCLRTHQAYFFSVSSKNSIGLKCECKYQCSDNFYKMSSQYGKFYHSAYYAYFKKMNLSSVGSFAVYYPRVVCSKFRTDIFMTWNDTLALYGGIVNLFIGGSIFTSFEIIIYILIRKYRIRYKQPPTLQYIE